MKSKRRAVWCVRAVDGIWHATFRNSIPRRARKMACGAELLGAARTKDGRRAPTCDECQDRVARRRKPFKLPW